MSVKRWISDVSIALDAKARAGHKAQRNGAAFENIFLTQAKRSGIATTRMPDGCRIVGKGRMIRVATPWDWILSLAGRSALLDTKTVEGKSFPVSKVQPHQVGPMFQHEMAGTIAGYLIWTRENDQVFFFKASDLLEMMKVRGASVTASHPKAKNLGSVRGLDGFKPERIFDPETELEKMVIHDEMFHDR